MDRESKRNHTVTKLFRPGQHCVLQPSIQVSEYSERNGGHDKGILYIVEALFPDGEWTQVGHHTDLDEAKKAAAHEAQVRGAVMLEESLWPNRQVIPARHKNSM